MGVCCEQTLTDKEYQRLRDASVAIIREMGVECGGSNVQMAVNPADGEVRSAPRWQTPVQQYQILAASCHLHTRNCDKGMACSMRPTFLSASAATSFPQDAYI